MLLHGRWKIAYTVKLKITGRLFHILLLRKGAGGFHMIDCFFFNVATHLCIISAAMIFFFLLFEYICIIDYSAFCVSEYAILCHLFFVWIFNRIVILSYCIIPTILSYENEWWVWLSMIQIATETKWHRDLQLNGHHTGFYNEQNITA